MIVIHTHSVEKENSTAYTVIPLRTRQEDSFKFEAKLSCTVGPCLKKDRKEGRKWGGTVIFALMYPYSFMYLLAKY